MRSSNYITNSDGNISQHIDYHLFGETFVEEHHNSNNSPYKFNAKELDDETGNYYYGTRYYNPKWSFWLSVDPLAEKFPGWSPYNYTMNNPINMVDPTGMAAEDPPPTYYDTLDEVIITTNTSNSNNTNDYSGMPQWYYQTYYKSAHEEMIRSIHGAHRKFIIGTYDLTASSLQDGGDGLALMGYGLTLTGVGASVGVPLAGAGNLMSLFGGGMEITKNLAAGDLGKGGAKLGLMVAEKLIEKGLNKALPGSANVFDKNFNLDKAILTQGASLKVGVADKIIQNQTENQK